MNINLSEIRKKTGTAGQYISTLEQPFKERFLAKKQTYQLQQTAMDQLRKSATKYMIIAFSAVWCKDCATIIPVLALINEATGLEVRVFGGLKRDPLSHTCKWRIPPSPSEVVTFNVDKIPLVAVVSDEGKEIGRIVESPKRWSTLEQELIGIIESDR